jgi:hypothetical protein
LLAGLIVADTHRSTVYNAFRVPLNALVIGLLLSGMAIRTLIECCVGMLIVAAVAGTALASMHIQQRS